MGVPIRSKTANAEKLILSRAIACAENFPSPQGKDYFPFQKAGIKFALGCRNTLITDPMGVGKTIQAIGVMNAKDESSVLIICPSSIVYNWKRELEDWHLRDLSIEIFHPKTFKGKSDVLIMGYFWASKLEAVKQVLKNGRYSICVIDEFHFLKNPESKRTKYVLAKNGLQSKAKNVIALSGTPIVNRPIELYPVIKSLCPEAIDNMTYFEFGVHYCDGFKNNFGWDFNGASNLKELSDRLRSHCMIRRPKEEILKDLPPKFSNLVYLEPTKDAGDLIQQMKTYEPSVKIGKLHDLEFDQISTARRELGEEKVDQAIEYIKTQIESGREKILIFAHHKSVIAKLECLSKYGGLLKIVGDTPAKEREEIKQKFQTDPNYKFLLLSITTAIGMTLTAASYGVFVEFSWVPGENDQAGDRMHRHGQLDNVILDYLVFEGSLDELILKQLLKKTKTIKEITA